MLSILVYSSSGDFIHRCDINNMQELFKVFRTELQPRYSDESFEVSISGEILLVEPVKGPPSVAPLLTERQRQILQLMGAFVCAEADCKRARYLGGDRENAYQRFEKALQCGKPRSADGYRRSFGTVATRSIRGTVRKSNSPAMAPPKAPPARNEAVFATQKASARH